MLVVSVKVSPKLKEEMERVKSRVQWPEEIRKFIQSKLEEQGRRDSLEMTDQTLRSIRRFPKGSTARLVREDRDNHY